MNFDPFTILDSVGKILYSGDSHALACMAMLNAPDGAALFHKSTMLTEKIDGLILPAEEGLMVNT